MVEIFGLCVGFCGMEETKGELFGGGGMKCCLVDEGMMDGKERLGRMVA